MARTRTTKKLAQRIDLNYFKRPSSYKRAKFWLCVVLPVLALGWIVWRSFARDSRVYSSGRMSAAHAVLEKECATCHLQQAGAFSEKAADQACLACHDGPAHHPVKAKQMECATCHTEHRGRVNIKATSNQTCSECHANLDEVDSQKSHFANHIESFQNGHPEFDVATKGQSDPQTIKLNHYLHMKAIRRGPNGPMVQLACGDCHRPSASTTAWPYADAKYVGAKVTYSEAGELRQIKAEALSPHGPGSGRELMAPVKFGTACGSCHLLTFDKRFDDGVPHDKPEVVHAFLVKRYTEYIAAHPGAVRVVRDPKRDLTGKPIPPDVRVLTPTQFIAESTATAEELLWRKTCNQCHKLTNASGSSLPQVQEPERKPGVLPQIAASNVTAKWMPHAKFDHGAHVGFTCVSCHKKALSSTETSDILLPGIATCQTCHAPGPDHAESRCYECHSYHDWAQRKEVTPKFTLPALRTGGQ